LIQALHKQPSHDLKSKNGQPMDRGTYHRARGLFGFGYRAINHRSGRPEGAKGDSPGQSEAPPWVHCSLAMDKSSKKIIPRVTLHADSPNTFAL
jgi:hypothetical protein